MKFNNIIGCILICGAMLMLNACSGESDKDGNKSIEGHNDPANTGGKLSGDHGLDQASGVKDTIPAAGK